MGQMGFDELLKQMPAVAKAVNEFKSDAVQQQAFTAILRSLHGQDPLESNEFQEPNRSTAGEKLKKRKRSLSKTEGNKASSKKKMTTAAPSLVSDLNLRPKGKESLRDFLAQKSPKDNQEILAVIVYYLQKVLTTNSISQDHIYTAFKEISKKVPTNIYMALIMTHKRKGWVETKNMSDLKMTIPGENFVEHDLPGKKEPRESK